MPKGVAKKSLVNDHVSVVIWMGENQSVRSAGATLALGGPGERARARQMLEKAALLKADWAGSQRHPSMLLPKYLAHIPVLAILA